MVKSFSLVLIATLGVAHCHVGYWNTPNKLQPVHGLYVKPSVDGTTGDLYVAATEESGTKSQWLTDPPINFLPAATTQPIAYAPSMALPEEAVNPQKRAVISSPLQYTYAYPVPGHTEGSSVLPYPYTLPSSSVPTPEIQPSNTKDAPTSPSITPYQSFRYVYPQMLSAYADLLNAFKDVAGVAEEAGKSVSTQTPPMWPPSYAYPVQYVMVDPSAWAQNQATAVSSTPSTTATSTGVNDNE